MNHLGTLLKWGLKVNKSRVGPNDCISNMPSIDTDVADCKPHSSSKFHISFLSQNWSTFYFEVSLWLVIYQENLACPVNSILHTGAQHAALIVQTLGIPFAQVVVTFLLSSVTHLAQPPQPYLMPLCQQLKHLELLL